MVNFDLVCWQCGKRQGVEGDCYPQFAFELANVADTIGWKGVIDMDYGRSLVFCTEECRKKAVKKDGTYRLRPAKEKSCK